MFIIAIKGSISIQELLMRMEGTTSYNSMGWISKTLIETVKSDGDNVSVPTHGCACECMEGYEESLVSKYNGYFGIYKEVNNVSRCIKAAQAALMESVQFGFDTETEKYALYTANPGLFTGDKDCFTDKCLEGIIKKNHSAAQLKAWRVDIEYISDDTDTVNYSMVNNMKVALDEERVLLVPFLSIYSLMSMIKHFVSRGGIIRAAQDIDGSNKVRFVSSNSEVIKKYSPGADVEYIKPQYFVWDAFMYLPVLGAPGTTACVTNVNLFKLYSLKRVNSLNELRESGVRIIKDPVSEMVKENAIITSMMFLAAQDQEKFYHVFEELPRRAEILPDIDTEGFTSANISMYLHSLKAGELKKVLSLLPDAKQKIVNSSLVICKYEEVPDCNPIQLCGLLQNKVCRVLIRKKDFSLSTIICTNNKDILKAVYGEDYMKYYEGFSVRLRFALSEVEEGRPVLDALMANGFDEVDAQDFFARVVEKQGNMEPNIDTYRDVVYDIYGKKQRKPAETSNIMVRTLNSYLSKSGAVDYYRYVDPKKILKVAVLS